MGDTIERNTRLQMQLIEDLLDVSRIVAGQADHRCRRRSISPPSSQAALENVSALASTKSVRFDVEVEPGVAAVSADPVRMLQVVCEPADERRQVQRRRAVACR